MGDVSKQLAPAAENDVSFGGMDTFDESNMMNMTFQDSPAKQTRKRQKRVAKADQMIEIARNFGREGDISDLLRFEQFVPVTRHGQMKKRKLELFGNMRTITEGLFRDIDLEFFKPFVQSTEVPEIEHSSNIINSDDEINGSHVTHSKFWRHFSN